MRGDACGPLLSACSPPVSPAPMSEPRKGPQGPSPAVQPLGGPWFCSPASRLFVCAASAVPPQELSPECVLWATWASQSPPCPYHTATPPGVVLPMMTWIGEELMSLTIWIERPAHYGAAVVTAFLLCLQFSSVAPMGVGPTV